MWIEDASVADSRLQRWVPTGFLNASCRVAWLYGDCAPMISEPLRCRVPDLWDSFVLIWNPVALYPYLRYAWDGQDQRDQLSLYEMYQIDVAVECDRNQPRKTLGAYREALPYEKHPKRDSLSITASCLSVPKLVASARSVRRYTGISAYITHLILHVSSAIQGIM